MNLWAKRKFEIKKRLIHEQKSKQADLDLALYPRDLNVVASESESSSDDLSDTEPRIQFKPEECRNSCVLNFEFVPASPNVLHCIKLFPERLVTARDAVIKMSIIQTQIKCLFQNMQKKKMLFVEIYRNI